MPEQDLFLTDFHRFIIKFDEREEEHPLFSHAFWGFEMFVNVPKSFPSENSSGKQVEMRQAIKQMLTDYVLQRKEHLSIEGFLLWVNSNPGYVNFLRETGLGELKLKNFSKLYYMDSKTGATFDYKNAKNNFFEKEYIIKKFKAERPIKKEGDKRVIAEDGDCNYVISLDFGKVTCKVDAPISEIYIRLAMQEIADLYAEKCSFKDISKQSIINFANKHFSKALGIKIRDIESIEVKRIEKGEIMAIFSHNYLSGDAMEIE